MAPESKTFLATTILNDGQIVSYRSLSRELKVHINVAKKMLYEFHHLQNSRKPASVYATYVVDGVPLACKEPKFNGHHQDGVDVHTQSSPYMSSSMPQDQMEEDSIPSKKIVLAREDDLGAVKAHFEHFHSIHIYSLGPSPVQNLQILSECNRAINAKYIAEDPLVVGKQYGVIHNNGVKRRTGKRPVMPAQAAPMAKNKEKPSMKPQLPRITKQESSSLDPPSSSGNPSTLTPQAESKASDKKPLSKPISLKREQSDIFKSFSKPGAKFIREATDSSAGTSPAPSNPQLIAVDNAADETMKDAFGDEEEDSFVGMNKSKPELGNSRSEREEQLRKMMDEEDEDMEDFVEQPAQPSQESEPVDAHISQKVSSPEPSVITSGGRRRGKRKIIKKKTIKDDEGYLVTKEEPAWESFSEDEPLPQKERTPASTASSLTAKVKRPGGRPGQGNIMSFFGKK